MYLNNVKTSGGYTNEVTQILSFFTGKSIVMQKNRKMNIAYTEEPVGVIEVTPLNKVSNIKLEPEYMEYLQDISFLFRATMLWHKDSRESAGYKNIMPYEKISGFVIMPENEYVKAAKEGYLTELLEHHAAHGVVIPVKNEMSVMYDFCTQTAFYDGSVMVSDGVVRLIPTNTKPVTKFVKKFTVSDIYLCVNDLAYIENVGCAFAPITNQGVCDKLLNVKNKSSVEKTSSRLGSLNAFGG